MKTPRFLRYLLVALTCVACTAESRGVDSDGDGLSDKQEILFGTDPYQIDSDGDTIPDATDASPLDSPKVSLFIQIGTTVATREKAEVPLIVGIHDAQGRWVTLDESSSIAASTSFGTLSSGVCNASFCDFLLSATTDGTAIVSFQTTSQGVPDGRATETIQIRLTLDKEIVDPTDPTDPTEPTEPIVVTDGHIAIEEPGLNPGIYRNAGSMDGELWVIAVDGNTLDWIEDDIQPYAEAFVQVDLPDGDKLIGKTDDHGCVHFTDDRLNQPVAVTVGAKDSRYTTWMEANAKVISAGIHRRDITQKEADTKGAKITGTVRGFWGETGLDTFPIENDNVFDTINLAIVQVGIRNTPLSSMNTGSILLPPDSASPTAAYFEIPPNLALASRSDSDSAKFSLSALKPGKYIVFALAGAGSNIVQASQNPYEMKFTPMAIGFQEVEVQAGETAQIQIELSVDLRTDDVDKTDVYFGHFPNDPETDQALPMGLLLPLMNTGKGYIFLDVNSKYNFDDFTNPLQAIYPRETHATLQNLNMSVHPMAVGLAARKAINGFDLPGISTLIEHPKSGDQLGDIYMNSDRDWLPLPTFITPTPPTDSARDAVGGALNPDRRIAWDVANDYDMTILRFNYMTPPIHNKILDSDIGASQAHLLWEVYVPSPTRQIVLPTLDVSAPDYPVLKNYAPTTESDPYQYAESTIELEINAYAMSPSDFHYNANFLIDDVNMNARAVSQDSYLIDAQ